MLPPKCEESEGSVADAQHVLAPQRSFCKEESLAPLRNLSSGNQADRAASLPTNLDDMPTRNGKRLFGDETIVTAAEKQHLDKSAESVQAPLAAPRAQNEREAEKINSLRAELARVTEEKGAENESLRADKEKATAGELKPGGRGGLHLAPLCLAIVTVLGLVARVC